MSLQLWVAQICFDNAWFLLVFPIVQMLHFLKFKLFNNQKYKQMLLHLLQNNVTLSFCECIGKSLIEKEKCYVSSWTNHVWFVQSFALLQQWECASIEMHNLWNKNWSWHAAMQINFQFSLDSTLIAGLTRSKIKALQKEKQCHSMEKLENNAGKEFVKRNKHAKIFRKMQKNCNDQYQWFQHTITCKFHERKPKKMSLKKLPHTQQIQNAKFAQCKKFQLMHNSVCKLIIKVSIFENWKAHSVHQKSYYNTNNNMLTKTNVKSSCKPIELNCVFLIDETRDSIARPLGWVASDFSISWCCKVQIPVLTGEELCFGSGSSHPDSNAQIKVKIIKKNLAVTSLLRVKLQLGTQISALALKKELCRANG